MGFSGAGSADEDGVAPGIEESAGGEFAHLALIDRHVGEDEAVEVFEHGELGIPDAIADASGLPMGAHARLGSCSSANLPAICGYRPRARCMRCSTAIV